MSNPSNHEQPEILAHHVTISAVIPLPVTDPATWDVRALLAHLEQHTEHIQEVCSFRLVPDPSTRQSSGPELLPF
jgi:hypothetical protein